jgi:hypothetical protein
MDGFPKAEVDGMFVLVSGSSLSLNIQNVHSSNPASSTAHVRVIFHNRFDCFVSPATQTFSVAAQLCLIVAAARFLWPGMTDYKTT